MNLATLQSQFAKALHYQALGEDCDIASDEFTADERMQIYRNNFIVSLSEVLSATYPMVEALLGKECFEQMARQHVLTWQVLPSNNSTKVRYGLIPIAAQLVMKFGNCSRSGQKNTVHAMR